MEWVLLFLGFLISILNRVPGTLDAQESLTV